jgi:CHAD domain-containing protein
MSRLPRAAGDILAEAGLEAASAAARAAPGERVHDVRVACRRLRAYWRLLGAAAGGLASRRRRRELTLAARSLASAREREALHALARELASSDAALAAPLSGFPRRLPSATASARLEKNLARAAAVLKASARALAPAARSARRADLRHGLKKLKRKLERARELAVRRGGAADLHECRKRLKELRFVREAFGAPGSEVRGLRKAGDELGAARDLRLLAEKTKVPRGALETRARKLQDAALSRI